MAYTGAPWRSRFLRSPKVGIELTERPDFAPLGDLAKVKLGLKTGADEFFILQRVSGPKAGRVSLVGMKNYELTISLDDLLPMLKNPNQLMTTKGRGVEVPTAYGRYSGDWYYFAPRTRLSPTAKEYVEWGELQGVDKKNLVKANASNAWYRQTRKRVTSRWVLPYNSGYQYGAVDNATGAVLNGRLVGVEPNTEVNSELLGAVLNSTPVTMSRLLEGVATGNEGAFDVGPPAARLMQVPDVRQMTEKGTDSVLEAFEAIRRTSVLPSAPTRDGYVDPLRRRLDIAVLSALGMSDGQATVLINRVYTSYSRWRAAVEDVETEMQKNRRALKRRGGSRHESPVQRNIRQIWDEISPTIPLLLAPLLEVDYEVVDPILPEGETPQDMLFDATTVASGDGSSIDLKHETRIQLVRMMRDFGFAGPIPLPINPMEASKARDEVIRVQAIAKQEIELKAGKYVSADLVPEVVSGVERKWLSKSFADVREQLSQIEDRDESSGRFSPLRLIP